MRGALPPKPRATTFGTSVSLTAPGCTLNLFLPYVPARPFSLMMRQTRRRLTVTPDLLGDALILRDPFRPLLAACAAAAAVAPDIKVLEGRVVSGDQFVSPAEQKERILATFGDLCCEMEGCTIAQAAYLNGVPLVVVRAIVSVNLFFTSFAKQAHRSRKGGFTGCANAFSPIPVTA